jgi:hypothetical protein
VLGGRPAREGHGPLAGQPAATLNAAAQQRSGQDQAGGNQQGDQQVKHVVSLR